ncbi:522_t:CDS:1, partial [Entrophospora sp. SA101]
SGYRPQFYFGGTDVTGTITLIDKDGKEDKNVVVEPGSTVDFKVELAKPVTIEEKKNFVIREGNHTIGQGTIIELL